MHRRKHTANLLPVDPVSLPGKPREVNRQSAIRYGKVLRAA
jgi:hypothetical protein